MVRPRLLTISVAHIISCSCYTRMLLILYVGHNVLLMSVVHVICCSYYLMFSVAHVMC